MQGCSVSPSASQGTQDKFSAFFNDPDADILLRSIDGRLFATQRIHLQSASAVFRDMLGMPQPVKVEEEEKRRGQKAMGVLPFVQMQESGSDLEVLLRWIHQSTYEALFEDLWDKLDLNIARQDILALLQGARKYDIKNIQPNIKILAVMRVRTHTATVLALAILFNWPDVAELAVREWIGEFEATSEEVGPDGSKTPSDWTTYNVRTGEAHEGVKPWSICDIWPELHTYLPPGFYVHIAQAQERMVHSRSFDPEMTLKLFMSAFKTKFAIQLWNTRELHTIWPSTQAVS